MTVTLNSNQQDLVLFHTGGCDVGDLIDCVVGCGFDSEEYIASHLDLRQANLTPAEALPHFLCFGWRENRAVTAKLSPFGLAAIFELPIRNIDYKNRLLNALFLGGVRGSKVTERLWSGNLSQTLLDLQNGKGRPFFVLGDSHSEHYERVSICEQHWFAPLLMMCTAGSAGGLANKDSKSQYGKKILSWAKAVAKSKKPEFPILMKFGQVDAEFVWNFRRIRDGINRFSFDQFALFAEQSVRQYSMFLRSMMKIIGSNTLHVCSIFPPALSDEAWAKGYMNEHIGVLEGDRALSELQAGFRNLEKPTLPTRTQLHAIYNGFLEDACGQLGLVFLDDFHPFLNGAGVIDSRYVSESKGWNHHIDFNQTHDVIVERIPKFLAGQKSHSCSRA